MKYKSPDQLTELTLAADRTQSLLDSVLTDIEQMPPTSVQFRLSLIKPLMDALYRMTSIRKTIIALRASVTRNTDQLRHIAAMVYAVHQELTTLKRRAGSAGACPSEASGAGVPP